MAYSIGDYVDLTYINKKNTEVASRASKKSVSETLYDIGVAFRFEKIGNQLKAARVIPVTFAS